MKFTYEPVKPVAPVGGSGKPFQPVKPFVKEVKKTNKEEIMPVKQTDLPPQNDMRSGHVGGSGYVPETK
jgi:hypothetical protein